MPASGYYMPDAHAPGKAGEVVATAIDSDSELSAIQVVLSVLVPLKREARSRVLELLEIHKPVEETRSLLVGSLTPIKISSPTLPLKKREGWGDPYFVGVGRLFCQEAVLFSRRINVRPHNAADIIDPHWKCLALLSAREQN
jgi:hypothetical protein